MPDINVAYQWAINTCNAPNVGYSQLYRNQSTVGDITYYDCSSFIWYALMAGGWDVVSAHGGITWPFITPNMFTDGDLDRLGWHSVPITGEWKSGDIVGRTSHVEMVYSGGLGSGITMGAHGVYNRPLPDQVSIKTSPSTASEYTWLYRYGEGGAEGYGLSIYVISAIAGNWFQESGINAGVWESLIVHDWNYIYGTAGSNQGGYGLGQWTNTSSQYGVSWRLRNLHDFLTENGYADDDPEGEIAFMIEENFWIGGKTWSKNFTDFQDFLQSPSTDIEFLTRCFLDGCEGIYSESQASKRINNAKKVLSYINAHAQDPSINKWIIGNRYLGENEILNNAVMLYRLLSTGGGGGKEKHLIHRMPVWMMARRFW